MGYGPQGTWATDIRSPLCASIKGEHKAHEFPLWSGEPVERSLGVEPGSPSCSSVKCEHKVHGPPLYRKNIHLLRNPAIEGEYDVHGLPR